MSARGGGGGAEEPLESAPRDTEQDFIHQHLQEKEGRTEHEQWSTLILFSDGKEPESRILVLTSLCLYLFQSTTFKKSVSEAPLLQLELVDATMGKHGEPFLFQKCLFFTFEFFFSFCFLLESCFFFFSDNLFLFESCCGFSCSNKI
jgi:hypothetical protein